jgi:hypothetical protein
MVSYLAVAFFCISGECYFWSGQALHSSEASCQQEVATFAKAAEDQGVNSATQCLKVPLRGA